MLARFGLMHIAATNLCVWIRTLVLEALKEITLYHRNKGISTEDGVILGKWSSSLLPPYVVRP